MIPRRSRPTRVDIAAFFIPFVNRPFRNEPRAGVFHPATASGTGPNVLLTGGSNLPGGVRFVRGLVQLRPRSRAPNPGTPDFLR